MRTTLHLPPVIAAILLYTNVVVAQKQSIEIKFIEEIDFSDVGDYAHVEYAFSQISSFKNRDAITNIIRE